MRPPETFAVACALVLGACTATSAHPTTTPDVAECDGSREEAGARWSAVEAAARAAAASPPDAPETPASRALEALRQHVESLRETPRELSGEDAMTLSNTMMDGIDALGAALPDAEREQADDAAEALLTDRSRDGARRSASGALRAFEAAVSAAYPQHAAAETEREAAEGLAARARRAVEGYGIGVEEGDRAADRAEAAPLGEGATELRSLRDAATEASRHARESCGVPRTLAVPGL